MVIVAVLEIPGASWTPIFHCKNTYNGEHGPNLAFKSFQLGLKSYNGEQDLPRPGLEVMSNLLEDHQEWQAASLRDGETHRMVCIVGNALEHESKL